jgi:glycine dehydrogenase subunit 1
VRFPVALDKMVDHLDAQGILAGVPLWRFGIGMDDLLLVAVTEQRTKEEMDAYVQAVKSMIPG